MASAKMLFYSRGFTETSVDAIASAAHISKGLVYHYFRDKKDILLSFSEDVEVYLITLTEMDSPLDALIKFGSDFLVNDVNKYTDAPPIQILLTTFAEHKYDFSNCAKQNPILMDIGRNFLANLFQRGIEEGLFKEGNAAVFGDIYWSFLLGKLLTVKKGNEKADPGEYVTEIMSVFRKES